MNIDPSSYVDPNGRVYSAEGRIYRQISPVYEETARLLFSSGTVERLVCQGLLVETSISDVPDPHLILEHRPVSPPSYCVEWPFLLLKKAAILTLRLSLELLSHSMYLQDAHPWNIFFEGSRPVFIDFTSLVRAEARILWPAYQQFCQFFLFPLVLTSCGRGDIARLLLQDYLNGVGHRDVIRLLPLRFKATHFLFYLKRILPEQLGEMVSQSDRASSRLAAASQRACAGNRHLDRNRRRLYEDLLHDVESLSPPQSATRWTAYYGQEAQALDCKRELVDKVIKRLRPATVLDVGANTGEFSVLAAEAGARVVALERDEACAERLACRAEDRNLPILPLIMDFANPTPAFGWAASQFPSAPERFQAELVLALALVHHLVFHQRQSFQRLLSGLRDHATSWLLIEFVEMADIYIRRWAVNTDRFAWYTRAGFEAALHEAFATVESAGSVTATRHLYLCRK